jgi:hypothetical protein
MALVETAVPTHETYLRGRPKMRGLSLGDGGGGLRREGSTKDGLRFSDELFWCSAASASRWPACPAPSWCGRPFIVELESQIAARTPLRCHRRLTYMNPPCLSPLCSLVPPPTVRQHTHHSARFSTRQHPSTHPGHLLVAFP